MNWIKEYLGRLLERNFPIRNVTCLFVAVVLVAIFYFMFRHTQWLQEVITVYGNIGMAIALLVVFLIAFLGTWLVWHGLERVISRRREQHKAEEARVISRQREQHRAEEARNSIRATLLNLSPWQIRFLQRFILERRTQIPDYEVGQYRAVWDSEMEVLIQKRVVTEIPGSGVYEIRPIYCDYLIRNWNPETGDLA